MKKRLLSMTLVVAMLLSLVTVSASAAGGVTVSLSAVSYTDTNATSKFLREGATVTSAGVGDKVAIKVTLTNNTDSTIYFSGYSLTLNYDKNVFETTSFAWEDDNSRGTAGPITQAGQKKGGVTWDPTVNTEAGAAKWAATSKDYVAVEANASIVLGYLLLKVKSDAESVTSSISFSTENYVKSAASSSATTDSTISDAAFGTPVSLTINGAPPTLKTVTLTAGSGTTLGESNTITVKGGSEAAQTIQAKAASAKGTDITGKVTWSVSPENQGVSVGTDGKITVANNATAGDYTITATTDGNIVKGEAMTATIKVERETAVAKTIEISGGVETIYLPGNVAMGDEFDSTTYPGAVQYWESNHFTAVVKDQYGEVIANPNVTWTFEVQSGQSVAQQCRDKSTHDYVTHAEGESHGENCEIYNYIFGSGSGPADGLEISASGNLMITNGCNVGTATVKAVCSDASATKNVTVTKADLVPATVTIDSVTYDNVLIVPNDQATKATYYNLYATVQDQYGDTLSGQHVTWSIVDAEGNSVSVGGMELVPANDDTKLALSNSAKSTITDTTGKTYTLKATCGNASGTKEITVKRAESVATTLAVSRDGTLITGDTDTVTIPTGDTPNNYPYTAEVLDQYGKGMTSKTVTLSLTGATDKGVTFNSSNGTLSVAKGATRDKEYTLKASYGTGAGESRTITITVKDIDIVPPTPIIKDNPIYGDTWAEIVTGFTGGSAKLNNDTVAGEFYLKTTGSPDAGTGQQFSIWFKSNNGEYDVKAGTNTADVAQKPLTITAKDHEITYGEAPANSGVTYSGFITGEDENELTGTLAYTYDGYTEGTSGVGTYQITPSGLTSGNYDITFVPGTLTVKAKALTDSMVSFTSTDVLYYNGTARTPEVTVTDGTTTLVKNTDYTVSYSNNKNAGTATATITGMGNYTGKVEKNFTITPAPLTITSATFEDKTYDGTNTATVTDVTFSGLQNGETLTLNTDYTATGEFAQKDKGDSVSASVTVTLGSTDKAKNYTLTATTKENAGTAKISPVQTTLSLTAANAVYTGTAYAVSNITKVSNVETDPTYTYYADNNGAKGDALTSGAPKDAGTYWVSGYIAASGNNSEVTSAAVQFQITKAPLTIKAEDKAITYGDAVPGYTVTYIGLVNSETGATVVSSLGYACDYAQFSNAGTYTITPKGATAANYSITYTSGTLTVNKKPVTLTWSADSLYYDGTAKTVTAAANGLVNSDAVSVTVVGGTQTDIGKYTATATALTGDKAGNYALPADATRGFEIKAALESVTVTPKTITATVNGLTIKLTGYRTASETVTVTGNGDVTAADGKLTVNGVTYTVDASGVVEKSADITSYTEVTTPSKENDSSPDLTGSTSAGLGNAAADTVFKEAENTADVAEVIVTLEIKAKTYTTDGDKKELVMEITPTVTYKDSEGNTVGSSKTLPNSAIKAPVTIKIKLPSGMVTGTAVQMFAKHLLSGGGFEYLPVTITTDASGSYYASWQQSSFSEVTLVTDSRTATVAFTKADGSILNKTYTPTDIGAALPTDSQTGKTFNGWSFTKDSSAVAGIFKTLTDELLTNLNGGTSITAESMFTTNSGGSYSGGSSGGGSSKFAVSVDKASNGSVNVSPSSAKKGETVTITVKPDKGYTLETLTVLDQNGKTVAVTAKNGTYTFTMPNGKVTVKATFMDDNTMLNFFTDVPATAYCYDAVLWAVENGVTNGLTETTFGMNSPCTRGQIVTFLWRAAGSPAPKGTVKVPADVKPGSYCYDAVAWALENGVTNGFADGSFGVNTPCTRAQAVTFLYRAMGTDPSIVVNFTDVGSSAYYAEAVAWAVENEVTLGTTGTTFSPNNTCTRGHIVTFLYRAYQGL